MFRHVSVADLQAISTGTQKPVVKLPFPSSAAKSRNSTWTAALRGDRRTAYAKFGKTRTCGLLRNRNEFTPCPAERSLLPRVLLRSGLGAELHRPK